MFKRKGDFREGHQNSLCWRSSNILIFLITWKRFLHLLFRWSVQRGLNNVAKQQPTLPRKSNCFSLNACYQLKRHWIFHWIFTLSWTEWKCSCRRSSIPFQKTISNEIRKKKIYGTKKKLLLFIWFYFPRWMTAHIFIINIGQS